MGLIDLLLGSRKEESKYDRHCPECCVWSDSLDWSRSDTDSLDDNVMMMECPNCGHLIRHIEYIRRRRSNFDPKLEGADSEKEVAEN